MKFKPLTYLVLASIVASVLTPISLLGCVTTPASSPAPVAPNPPPVAPTPPPEVTPSPPTIESPAEPARVEVVYFHRANRCHSCMYAEEQTRYTLETYFADELASGDITFESVNVQDKNNADIIEKYNAYTSQLFINMVKGNTEHIEEVTEFWDFIDDDEGFSLLIRTKINDALEGAG